MRHAHFLCGNKARAPNDQGLQLALPVHLALLLPLSLLLLLLLGMVAAVEAAGGGAEDAVMAGIVAGDAADDGAPDAALGVGGGSRATDEKYGGDGGEGFHGSMSPDAVLRPQQARARPGSAFASCVHASHANSCRRPVAQPPIAVMNLALRLRVIWSAISPVVLRIAGIRGRALARRKLHTANENGRNDGREAQSPARAASARRHLAQRSRGRAVVLHRRRRLPHPRADRCTAAHGPLPRQEGARRILAHRAGAIRRDPLRGAADRRRRRHGRGLSARVLQEAAATTASFRSTWPHSTL